jgi:hypothetical protein
VLNTTGLSLEQAPPLGVPFTYFLTAPWFAAAAGLALVWLGPGLVLTRWAPSTVAATHLLGLGYLGLTIVGALFQLLPVLVGAPVPRVVLVSRLVYGLLVAGIGLLVSGFWVSSTTLQVAALAPLASAVLVLAAALAWALRAASVGSETAQAIELSIAGLLLAAGLGATVVLALDARVGLMSLPGWVDLHLSWALLGWAGMLLVAIGAQLVPLFHVTPPYPAWFRRAAPTVLFLALLGMTAGHVGGHDWLGAIADGLALAVLAAFAVLTLRLQAARRRQVWDPTLSFWWLGMACLLGAVVAWLLDAPATTPGVLALAGVAVAVPAGVLYKVAPFLAWFHLQAAQMSVGRWDVVVPHMKSFVGDRAGHLHFALHAAALALLLGALAGWDVLARPAGVLFTAGAVVQGVNLLRVYRLFRAVRAQLEGVSR